jgi:hypothetical protein
VNVVTEQRRAMRLCVPEIGHASTGKCLDVVGSDQEGLEGPYVASASSVGGIFVSGRMFIGFFRFIWTILFPLWPILPPGQSVTQNWPLKALGWPLLVTGPRPGPVMAAYVGGCGYLFPFLLCKAFESSHTLLEGGSGLTTAGMTV